MAEVDLAQTIVAIAGTLGGGGLVRWIVGVWREVRREGFAQAKETATQQRADNERMVAALLANERSNAQLAGAVQTAFADFAGKFGALATKLDTLLEWRERTPVEGFERVDPPSREPSEPRRRARTPAQGGPGYRPPSRGQTNNEG